MTCIGNCNMHPILNACSFLAGRLEEEAARPGCIKTPARCTARAELQLQNMADHGHHNATEADHITTLGGREGRLNHRPQPIGGQLRFPSRKAASGFAGAGLPGRRDGASPRSYENLSISILTCQVT